VETDARLQIHLVDVTRGELVADLAEHDTAEGTDLYARLNALAPASEGGWSVLVAHTPFHGTMQDMGLLERLAHVGAALDAPWLAEAPPELALGPLDDEASAAWTTFRAAPVAQSLGLAMPRVLLRLPYGSDTEQTEQFAFEELESPEAHNSYLWGNPALCCARLLAEGFTERGSGLAPARGAHLGGLPLHITRHAGEVRTKPCAEIVMTENDAMALLEAGFIPMLSFRDQDVVRVRRIQSIAGPAVPLRGRMGR
jgi:type VI secretion system protein ImpC